MCPLWLTATWKSARRLRSGLLKSAGARRSRHTDWLRPMPASADACGRWLMQRTRSQRHVGRPRQRASSGRRTDVSSSEPPHELRPGSGRRGSDNLWRRFDAAAADLSRAAAGTDILGVADAYRELGEVAGELAEAVDREDEASGPRQRKRARQSA